MKTFIGSKEQTLEKLLWAIKGNLGGLDGYKTQFEVFNCTSLVWNILVNII